MTIYEWAVAAAAVSAGACLQGSVGFGLNLVSAPVLVAIDPLLVPGPANFLGLVLTLLVAYREREAMDLHGLGWALAGRIPGTVAGSLAVVALPLRGLGITFAVLLLVAVTMSASGWHVPRNPPTLLGAGAVSGFMGTTASIGGPAIALVYQEAPGSTIRGTLAAYFVVGVMLSLASLTAVGRFGGAEIKASLALVPPLVAGFAASRWTASRLDRRHTRAAILAVAALAAVALLARYMLAG